MESVILKCLIDSKDYFRKIINFYQPNYFRNKLQRDIFNVIKEYFSKYNKKISYEVLRMEINDNENMDDDNIKIMDSEVEELQNMDINIKDELDYFVDKTEQHAIDVYTEECLMESMLILKGESDKHDKTHIPQLMKNALALSLDKNLGHDYFKNADERYKFYHTDAEKLPTDIDVVNTMLNGGFPKKTLNVFMSGVNKGKCVCKNININIRNKKTGEIKQIKIVDFFNMIKRKE